MRTITAVKELSWHSVVYATGDLFSKGLAFLLLPLYTRYLLPGDYGILSVCLAIIAVFTPLVSLGLAGAVTRFYVEFNSNQEKKIFITTIFSTIVLVGLGLLVVIDLLTINTSINLFGNIPYDPYLRLTLWTAFLSLFSVVPVAVLRMEEKPVQYGFLVYGNNILKVLLSAFFVITLGRGLLGALQGLFWANLVFIGGYLIVILQRSAKGFSKEWLRIALLFCVPLIPHLLFHWILSLSDRIILERFVTLDNVGIYSLGYQISMIIGVTITALNTAWAPYLMNHYKDPGAKELFKKLSTYFVFVCIFITLLVSLWGGEIIGIIADPSYHDAKNVIQPVAIGYLFLGLYFLPVNFLFLAKRTGQISVVSGIAAAVNIGFNLYFIPRMGIMAAAWATLIAYFVLFSGVFFLANRLKISDYEYRRIGLLLLTGLIIIILNRLISFPNTTIDFLYKSLLMLSYPVFLFFEGFYSQGERLRLNNAVRSVPKWVSKVFSDV